MSVLTVQYAGDYREAAQRFAEGGIETYYAQKYSVDAVAEMGKRHQGATVLCCMTAEPYDEIVHNGVRAIGAGFKGKIPAKQLIKLIAEQNPSFLILRAPIREVLVWAIQNKVRTIAVFAESVSSKGWRSQVKNYLLARLLNHPQIEWVGTYGLNSSLLFQKIGVKSEKIIPWDFILDADSGSFTPKTLPTNLTTAQLFYIGSLIESKGVGDILEAIALLKAKNISVCLKVVGKDEGDYFYNKAKQLNIENSVEFAGIVPNNQVEPLMRESQMVLVPSRHEYPEGFPLTIHHALRSRTPIIASDHPMFKNYLKQGTSAMIFPAGNSHALSESIEKLLSDSTLYHSLSLAAGDTWERLKLPVKWAQLIDRWLDNTPESQQWLFERRLGSGRYSFL